MELKYTLQENDYLNFYNFNASRNDAIKKRKLRSWILLSAVFFGVGLFTFLDNKENVGMMIYAFSMGTIIAVGYPFYFKWRYQKYYKNLIRTQLKDKLGVETCLFIHDKHLVVNDAQGEMKWDLNSFIEIAVTEAYLFLYVKGGGAIILPQSNESFINQLLQTFKDHQIHIKRFN